MIALPCHLPHQLNATHGHGYIAGVRQVVGLDQRRLRRVAACQLDTPTGMWAQLAHLETQS